MSVDIGGTEYTVAAIKGWKATRATKLLGRLGDRLPKLIETMANYSRDYSESHYTELTREQALADAAAYNQARDERIAELLESDGDPEVIKILRETKSAPERMTEPGGGLHGKESIRIPQQPPNEVVAMVVMAQVADIAEAEFIELLGLLVTTTDDAWAALEKGGQPEVDKLITKAGQRLLHEGEVQELAEFVLEGALVLQAQFETRRSRLGELWGQARSALSFVLPRRETDPETSPTNEPSSAPSDRKPDTETTTSSLLDSSTSSPEPTVGPSEKPSTTVPSGETSSPSLT